MRMRKVIICILLASAILVSICYQRGLAKGKEEIAPARIGVACVDRILLDSKKHAEWQKQMEALQIKNRGELEKLSKEIEMIRAAMNTRKVGSEDYLKLFRQGTEKQALLEVAEKFYEQEMNLKAQSWTEQLYKEIISATEKVAKEKGLDLILARDDLASASTREIMTLIRTSKVLYNSEDMDITEDVLAVLDGAK